MTAALIRRVIASGEDDFRQWRMNAQELTQEAFGATRVLFNPVYVSNVCTNDCPYCGYRSSNSSIGRRSLRAKETAQEGEFLKRRGVEHLLLLAGEFRHDQYVALLLDAVSAIKTVRPSWVGLEAAPLSTDDYVRLRARGLDAVVCFQEIYDRDHFAQVHRDVGPKSDYDFRLGTLTRAAEAGVAEVGLGVLLGLSDPEPEVVAMAEHATQLRSDFPNIRLRFSLPRLMPSAGQDPTLPTVQVGEEFVLRCVVALRLAFPDAGIVLTGRETTEFLVDAASIANILGKAGSTAVGGYTLASPQNLEQFSLARDQDFLKFRQFLVDAGYSPV